MSYETIENVARHVRAVLTPNLAPTDRLPHGTLLFDSLEKFVVTTSRGPITFDVGVAELPHGVEGQTRYDSETNRMVIELSIETYRKLEQDYPRALLTVGHEIGHGSLHAEQLLRMSTIPHRQMALHRAAGATHPQYCDTEWQATALAAALAAPAVGLEALRACGHLTVYQVQRSFRLSAEAADVRIKVFLAQRRKLLAA